MAKKIKYGKVEVPLDNFDDANAVAHISIRLPLNLVKELKKLSLTEEHGGKYQVLIRDVLNEWVLKHQHRGKKRLATV
jgi:hypothetical protein